MVRKERVEMKFIKLHEEATIPTRATQSSAGYDFYANEDVIIPANTTMLVKTDISFEGMNEHQFMMLTLRSSVGLKTPLMMANGVGIIDSDYAGRPIGLILYNSSKYPYGVRKGDKVAQGIILCYDTVAGEIKPKTERQGGFGSTDNTGGM